MLHEIIFPRELSPNLPLGDSPVMLTTYARPRTGFLADDGHRWGVLILPGGGYHVVADTEGEPVALNFLAAGVQAFVLRYSTLPARYPQQLLEAAAAMAWMKEHRDYYGIDRFAVCGFSAGGHLAGCLANLWQDPVLSETLDLPCDVFRPDAVILSYPVISRDCSGPGSATFPNLLGENADAPEFEKLSLETSVGEHNPPTFLWCTCSDQTVDMENTMRYARALQAQMIPFSLHVFPRGPHAMALGTRESVREPRCLNPHAARWMPLCIQWLKGEVL